VAVFTAQLAGIAGVENRSSERTLWLGPLDITFRIESVPLFAAGLPWSIQPSATMEAVTDPLPQSGSTVQEWLAGEPSALPAASIARTRNSCVPIARPV
jgi:hypothetical protein